LIQAQELVWDLFVRHTGFGDYNKKYNLKERIDQYKFLKEVGSESSEKKWEKFFKENPDPE
jgi:hypothetical protein